MGEDMSIANDALSLLVHLIERLLLVGSPRAELMFSLLGMTASSRRLYAGTELARSSR